MTIPFKPLLFVLAVSGLLTGCGGGGSDASSNSASPGPTAPGTTPAIAAAGVAYGTVTGYGSIIVNGVHYEDNGVLITRSDDSTVRGDGQASSSASSSTRAALPVGSVVRVDFNSASDVVGIRSDDSISGRVEGVSPGTGITVMGQTVRIDDTTSQYEDNVLRTGGVALAVGDFVRIQGQPDDNGGLLATLVSRSSSSGALLEVKGRVSNHTANSLSIGSLNVRYDSSTVTSDMPSGSWDGLLVEVKGSNCSNASGPCGTLTATKVEPEGGLSSSLSRSQAEVEGIVRSGSAASFQIGNVSVVTSSSTRWSGGTADDFAVGVKLEAEGALSGGVLTATKVSLRDGSRLEGNVLSPVVSNGVTTFTLQGLPGITLKASNASGLSQGSHVRVRGRVAPDGRTVVVTRLDLRNADSRTELRSMVTAISGTTITLLGLPVDVGSLSSYSDSRASSGNSVNLSRSAFLAALQVGATVKLRSDDNGNSWKEAELEAD